MFRIRSITLAAGLLAMGSASLPLAAQQSKPKAPADSAKTKQPATTSKTPTKPSTTAAKPTTTTTTKPSTTAAKPATETSAGAKGGSTTAAKPGAKDAGRTGSTTAPAKAAGATSRGAATKRTAADTRVKEPPSVKSISLAAGGAAADLGFGVGPTAALVGRWTPSRSSLTYRGELSFSRFGQTAPGVTDKATLSHFGAAASVELDLAPAASRLRPYLVASVGAYRFQGDGPAGTRGDVPGGVFASTTDVGAGGGLGVRIGRRLFLEGRFITVTDFYAAPIVLGVTF
jgi:hypothetical protein